MWFGKIYIEFNLYNIHISFWDLNIFRQLYDIFHYKSTNNNTGPLRLHKYFSLCELKSVFERFNLKKCSFVKKRNHWNFLDIIEILICTMKYHSIIFNKIHNIWRCILNILFQIKKEIFDPLFNVKFKYSSL